MTQVQIIIGGQEIHDTIIAQHGGKRWYSAEVEGWETPPVLPENPNPVPITALPIQVRELLGKAMCKAIEKVTGFKVTVDVGP